MKVFDEFPAWLLGVSVSAALAVVSGYFLFFTDWRPFVNAAVFLFAALGQFFFNFIQNSTFS